MPIVQVQTLIHASQQTCFDLARDVEAHLRTTASTNEKIVGGKSEGLLELGDEVTFEARHPGVKQRLSAKIVAFDPPHSFTDQMTKGAFASLVHEHRFEPQEGGTLMIDILDFRSPLGPFGALFDRLFLAGYMRRFLIKRGLALKAEAESSGP